MKPNATHRITIIVIALLAAGLGGCHSGGTSSDASSAGALVAPATIDSSRLAAWIPTLTDLRTHVQMTDDQAAQIETALTQWKTVAGSRREGIRPEQRPSDGKGGRIFPPAAMFLSESGKVLQTDQFVALVHFLKEKRSEQKTPVAEIRSQFREVGIDRMARRMVSQLALSPDQEKQVRAALQELRASREESRVSDRGGMRPVSAQFGRLHEQLTERLSHVLTPDQRAQFDSLWTKRGERQNVGRDKRQEARIGNAIECLQGILQLSDSQMAQIRQVFAELSVSRLSDTACAGGMGWSSRPLKADANLFRRAESGVRPILSADQIKRFDAVLQLLPERT